jgi:ribonuclease HII
MARQVNKTIFSVWPDVQFESALWLAGKTIVVGIDEAGRGAWAGPVTAGAVVLPCNQPDLLNTLHGIRDSKLMTAYQRDYWADVIRKTGIACSSGWASCEEIDSLGILPATRLAMQRAVEILALPVDHLLIDAVHLPSVDISQTSLIKGDLRVLSIAAASVIAKTERDRCMQLMEEEIPGYGFARHKGYGTVFHREALSQLGVSVQHRKSYAPIKALLMDNP